MKLKQLVGTRLAYGKKLRGRPKMTWMEVIKNDMKLLELEERMVVDRNDWRRRIHVLVFPSRGVIILLVSKPSVFKISVSFF